MTHNNSSLPDLSACGKEPIHTPGSIQPDGVLIAMEGEARTIVAVSANAARFLAVEPGALLEKTIAEALGQAFSDDLEKTLLAGGDPANQGASFLWRPEASTSAHPGFEIPTLVCFVHEHEGRVFAEFELQMRDQDGSQALLSDALEAFQRVHDEPHLISKLQIAADVIRTFTAYDRVMIYRFDRDWNGEVVAEAVGPGLEQYLGLFYPASDIPPQARELYLISRVRVITDVHYQPVPLLSAGVDTQALDLSRCMLRSVSPVHIEYLKNMGVGATMVCSLISEGKLWGLISCHHGSPKPSVQPLRKLCSLLSRDLALQVQLCMGQRNQALVNHLARCRENVMAVASSGQHFSALLEASVGRDMLDLVQAEGVSLIMGGQVTCEGVTPPIALVRRIFKAVRREMLDQNQTLFATEKLSHHLPWAEEFSLRAAGVVVMSLPASTGAGLVWFRGERSRTVTWGGNPDKLVDIMPDGRIHPRKSFAAWKEKVHAQSLPWMPEELESAQTLQHLLASLHSQMAEQELRLLRQSVSQINDVVLITEAEPFDEPGPRIVFVNEAFSRTTGYSSEDVLGRTPRMLQGPDTERAELDRLRAALECSQPVRCELTNYRKDGTPFIIELDISPVSDENGWFTHLVSIQRDITNRKLVEASLQRSEEQYRQLVSQLTEGVLVIDEEGHVRSHNQSAASILELQADFADGRALACDVLALYYLDGRRVPPSEHPATLTSALRGESRDVEYQIIASDGKPRWISLNTKIMEAVGRNLGQGVLLSFRDVTEQHALRGKLSKLAATDPLTGLPNRAQFRDRLSGMLMVAERECALLDVILIDLDNFKDVNDTFGHGTGDQLLCQVAERFQSTLGPGELIARLGGDEFVACSVVSRKEQNLHLLAQKLRKALASPFTVEGIELQVVGSIGVASHPADGNTTEELLRKADIAMYAAKREHDQGWRIYSEELELSVQNHMAARLRLQRALEFNQFELHYQPKVSVSTGDIIGFEGLIRWRDEEDRLIMPGEFIHLAENTGMIHPIGEWALQQAVKDLVVLAEAGMERLTIAINVSAVQFKRPDLVTRLTELLKRNNVIPARLEIEVTESVLISDDAGDWQHLEQFDAAGINVFIDDFGTGYSNLAYLRRFKVDALKIDRSFVHGAAEDMGQAKLVKTIINMAHGLDLRTVAEGVETRAELDLLQELGCQAYQGFYFSAAKPLQFFLAARAEPQEQPDPV